MATRDQAIEKPQSIRFDAGEHRDRHPQEYYDEIKARFAAERELRLAYRPPGTDALHVRPAGRVGARPGGPVRRAPEPREADHRPRRGALHRRRVLGPADVGAPARAWRGERSHRRARRRRRRHVVLEPVPGHRLRRRVLRLPAAARRDAVRAVQALRGGPRDLRPLPGHRPPLRPLRPRRVPDDRHLDGVGRGRAAVDRHHRPRRPDDGDVRHLRQRDAGQAAPRHHRRHGDVRGDVVPHVAVGLRVHGPGPRAPPRQGRRHHRHGRQRRAGRAEPRRDGQGAVRLPADAVVDRRARRLADRPRVGSPPTTRLAGQAAGQDHRQGARRPPSATRRCATGSPARRRSAARRTPTSTP